jgi:hypothetical protein
MTKTKTVEEREEKLSFRRANDSPAKRRAWHRKSVSSWARFWGSWWYIPFGMAIAVLPTLRCGALLGDVEAAGMLAFVVFLVVMVGILASLAIAFVMLGRDQRRWAEMLRALPYEVRELEECLGDPPDANQRMQLVFAWKSDAPSQDELSELLRAEDGSWSVDPRGAAIYYPGPVGYSDTNSRRLAEWFVNLTNGSLVAVHTRWPIASVTVRNKYWED